MERKIYSPNASHYVSLIPTNFFFFFCPFLLISLCKLGNHNNYKSGKIRYLCMIDFNRPQFLVPMGGELLPERSSSACTPLPFDPMTEHACL